MNTMEKREAVNLKLSILGPLLRDGMTKSVKIRTQEEYEKKIAEFERNCEKSLIETFSRISINGMVKTDPYSLPYKDEVVKVLSGESYLNGCWEFHRVAREIVKELLNRNIYQLRFYMWINVIDTKAPFTMGKVEYRFRFYEKQY